MCMVTDKNDAAFAKPLILPKVTVNARDSRLILERGRQHTRDVRTAGYETYHGQQQRCDAPTTFL